MTGRTELSDADVPLTEADAERLIGAICFKTGPPGIIGAELEWLVTDLNDSSMPVPYDRVCEVLDSLRPPGVLPGGGLLTLEPGGQVELSTAPAESLAHCIAAAGGDFHILREAFAAAGLRLNGHGLDHLRPPRRVLDAPRYAAMEEYLDRHGRLGRVMMCSTASVQVCVDAGLDDDSTSGYAFRWRLVHALGPILVAAFANSPLREGRLTAWKCTRQLVWSRLDPCRTSAPAGAEPCLPTLDGEIVPRPRAPGKAPAIPVPTDGSADARKEWANYAMNASVLCQRRPTGERWSVPTDLTFRDWLRGDARSAGCADAAPTVDDLKYHLSTLFPPVRARGHLELRMIDAQPGDGWIVPVATVAALVDDPVAADAAMAATEPVWHAASLREDLQADGPLNPRVSPWLRAARHGLADETLAGAARECFAAANEALTRSNAPSSVTAAVADFTEQYVEPGRCPADDVIDNIAALEGQR